MRIIYGALVIAILMAFPCFAQQQSEPTEQQLMRCRAELDASQGATQGAIARSGAWGATAQQLKTQMDGLQAELAKAKNPAPAKAEEKKE